MSARKHEEPDDIEPDDEVAPDDAASAELARVIPLGKAEREARQPQPSDPEIGKWYWLTLNDEPAEDDPADYPNERSRQRGLWCITHLGSNYVQLTNIRESTVRVHLKDFEADCTFEPKAAEYVRSRIEHHRVEAAKLMGEVQEVTKALGVGMGVAQLQEGSSQALAVIAGPDESGKRLSSYKKALTKAKEKTLPQLFAGIEGQNKLMARWMKAELLPWKAQAQKLKPTVEAIEARIFNVELYAGLVEDVKCVREGKPAGTSTPLHVFQKRLYMDEECLAEYRSLMNFKKLSDFDKWLAQPENCNRLLPQPRCVVAFRIRNHDHDYMKGATSWRSFIKLAFEVDSYKQADKRTFLYIRNGEQLWRLETEIDFDENLFPDLGKQQLLTGQLYAKHESGEKYDLITEHDYRERRSEHAKALREYRAELRSYPARFAAAKAAFAVTWEQRKAEWYAWRGESEYRKKTFPEPLTRFGQTSFQDEPRWADVRSNYYRYDKAEKCEKGDEPPDVPEKPTRPTSDIGAYKPWTRDSVYWDDIAKSLKDDMDRYNRVVLVLQGLFDRSLALHPHPPVRLFEDASFKANVVLVYDDSRALVPGPKPSFEVYRDKLNATLKPGDICYGQHLAWGKREAERHNADQRRRGRDDAYEKNYYEPPGDPGPGVLARVVSVSKRTGKVRFEWLRKRYRQWEPREYYERQRFRELQKTSPLECSIDVERDELFNVSAYTPGDFRLFFADPRTRAEYAKWGPALLTAEDYHAGVEKVQDVKTAWMNERDY